MRRREPANIFTPPTELRALFERAGWHPDRQAELPPSVPANHPGGELLRALTGLTVGRVGRGIECGASDVRFRFQPPDAGISAWGGWLATTLVGVAAVHNLHGELYIDSLGRCLGRSAIHDAFYFEGSSFAEAIHRLLDGKRSRPMLRPDQSSVLLYGRTYTSSSPELYRFA
jgi:hypothetical protein